MAEIHSLPSHVNDLAISKKCPAVTVTEILSDDENLSRGTYIPPKPTDLRSPCPMVNSLANHGYLPRDGRNVHRDDIQNALNETGLQSLIGWLVSRLIFLDRVRLDQKPTTIWGKLWAKVISPFALLLNFAIHPDGQYNSTTGKKYINLNQVGDHNLIEHDVSLSRNDHAQGDHTTRQDNLVADIINASSDGRTITTADFAALRLRRIEKQRAVNPHLQYGPAQHKLGNGEISLILNVFGDGKKVNRDYVKAFFEEERLPYREGWVKKSGWSSIGLSSVKKTAEVVNGLIGLKV